MIFEVHITSKEIDRLEEDFLHIENLSPDLNIINTVKLSEYTIDVPSIEDAIEHLMYVCLEAACLEIDIERMKLECKPTDSIPALYYEVHLRASDTDLDLPLSRNVKTGKLIKTFRSHDLTAFTPFNREKVEQCVFDTCVEEDNPWFSSWKGRTVCA